MSKVPTLLTSSKVYIVFAYFEVNGENIMTEKIEQKFKPEHKAPPPELRKPTGKNIHITIDMATGYQLRHATARMGLMRKLSYDEIVRLLLFIFYNRKSSIDEAKAEFILKGKV